MERDVEFCRGPGATGLAAVCVGLLLFCGCAGGSARLAGPVAARGAVGVDVAPAAVLELAEAADACVAAERDKPVSDALRELGLADCLELAIRKNRRLAGATYAAQRQQEGVIAARRTLLDPQLKAALQTGGAEGSDAQNGKAGVVWKYGGLDVEPYIQYAFKEGGASDTYSRNVGVAVSRRLFSWHEALRQKLPVTEANKELRVSMNRRMLELRDLRLTVAGAFYEVQNLEKRVRLRESREADAEQFLATVGARVVNGFAAPIEESNARISLNQARADLVRERTNRQAARETLLDLLGLDLRSELVLRADEWMAQPVGAADGPAADLEADLTRVLEGHETVVNKLLELELFRIQSLTRRDNLLPALSAKATASQNQSGTELFSAEGATEDEVTLGLEFSMPLDAFRAERARVRQDEWRARELELELVDVRRGLEKELRQRHREIGKWAQTVQLASERLDAERRKLEATLKRYEAGGVENLEVTRAKQSMDDAEVALLDARVSQILAMARYAALMPPEVETPE